jgi:hypothetical protein
LPNRPRIKEVDLSSEKVHHPFFENSSEPLIKQATKSIFIVPVAETVQQDRANARTNQYSTDILSWKNLT